MTPSEEAARCVDEALARCCSTPENDCTDYACPSWWRGNDAGVEGVVRRLTALLDGERVGSFGYAPLEALSVRILALREAAK